MYLGSPVKSMTDYEIGEWCYSNAEAALKKEISTEIWLGTMNDVFVEIDVAVDEIIMSKINRKS